MSNTRFGIIPASLFDRNLGPAEVALIALLSTYADKEGWCWPSQTTLAKKLGKSRAWVIASLNKLEKTKILQITRKTGKISHYRIVYDTCQSTDRRCQPADTEQYQLTKEAPPTPPKQRKHGINPDWEPNSDVHQAMETRYPDLNVTIEAEKMVNWAIDQEKTGKDWNRRFQNWCRTAQEIRQKHDRKTPRLSPEETLERIRSANR